MTKGHGLLTNLKRTDRRWWKRFGWIALLWVAPFPLAACTIFVLTDGQRTLFFNNEDYSNPATRLWFIPAGEDHLGCAYVGFDNGWAQGGINTAGLAFDWVAGSTEKWKPSPDLQFVRGNPAQRMLESCATVEEAIAFFQRYWEPDFSRSRILIADRTGASAIIGARDNSLTIDRSRQSRGFGYGASTLDKMLPSAPEPVVAHGLSILRACVQKGENPTQYSNIFDLRSGDLHLFPSTRDEAGVPFNLAVELAKGAHYYDIPQLREQVGEPLRPLRQEMKRFPLDEFPPLPDQAPEVTSRIRRLIQDSARGTMRPDDYAPEFWSALSSQQTNIQSDLKRLGDFVSLTLVGRRDDAGHREFRYKLEFEKITVLQRFVLNQDNQVQLIQAEASELKPGAGMEKESSP